MLDIKWWIKKNRDGYFCLLTDHDSKHNKVKEYGCIHQVNGSADKQNNLNKITFKCAAGTAILLLHNKHHSMCDKTLVGVYDKHSKFTSMTFLLYSIF